ncbi:hypothetical protein VCO01S_00340 [Vibrio comitans NBRC 102076]|uniref:Uncharacterized protein n=1 Tax=Vibrio comitans NBRC 102076 TaxID=1219078 RepID=A0A4Y3IHI9_9VIBR|nr:hypothetical protein VCO01S_00340 [Vibrio comitans NBRC 102076]
MKRAYIVISEINPTYDLPKCLIPEFYDLQYSLNKNYSSNSADVLTDTISSLNAMELSLVTSAFIKIYSALREYEGVV